MTPSADRNEQGMPGPAVAPRRAIQVLVVGLVLFSALAGALAARWLRSNAVSANPPEPEAKAPPGGLFPGWDKPHLVLVLSGSQHGYLGPCGCSHPQFGGLERRYNFVQGLRDRGWTVAAVDVGDVPQLQAPRNLSNEQGLLKYTYSMRALKQIGYAAVSFGEYEAGLPLDVALASYALQDPVPRVLAANLKDRDKQFPDQLDEWIEIKNKGQDLPIKTAVTAIIGPSVAARIAAANAGLKLAFEDTPTALKRVLPRMQKAGADLRILLYQGLCTNHRAELGQPRAAGQPVPKPEAIACAERFPEFQVVLGVGEEEEPSSRPIMVNNGTTLVTSIGFKGRYVGIVGIWRTGQPDKPYRFEYQLAELGEDLATPADRADKHPIVSLIEEYTAELKRINVLDRFARRRHPLQIMNAVPGLRKGTPDVPHFVGSEKCKTCHQSAYKVWKDSDHAKAYETLVKAKRPGNRQFDGECIVCHTTGFGFHTGFTHENSVPDLRNVGCESCHGPGSHHVKNPQNLEWQKRMNEWWHPENETPADTVKRRARIDRFCQDCHNVDNDVNWTHNALDKRWPKIAHAKD
jgi:hypothetical protein